MFPTLFLFPHAWLEEFRITFNYDNQSISLATYVFNGNPFGYYD